MKQEIIDLSNGKTYNYTNKEDAVSYIIQEYVQDSDVCMSEFLKSISLNNISMEDVVEIYARAMYLVETDNMTIEQDGEVRHLANW